ncbi:hypothetical protein [Phytohabitans aurantiacus]|jgi:hypothetical protein|nr:hypothetical protein [Phytohabitans aurantiacus]
MPDTATPANGEPDEASDDQSAAPEDAPTFANRAERRAKGKGKSTQPHTHGKGPYPGGGRGSVQAPRQYGNRRTG